MLSSCESVALNQLKNDNRFNACIRRLKWANAMLNNTKPFRIETKKACPTTTCTLFRLHVEQTNK